MSQHVNIDFSNQELPSRHSEPVTRHTTPAPVYNGLEMVEEKHLLDYVKVIYKRRWTAVTAFIVVAASAAVYTFTATPVYEARTRLLIESGDPNVVTFKEVIDEGQTRTDYYQTQYNILQSRALARKTIDALQAWNSPLLDASTSATSYSLASLVKAVTALVSGDADAEPTTRAHQEAGRSGAIDAFLRQLMVSPLRNSRLVDLKVRSTNATWATSAANTLAKTYINQNLEYKFSASREASSWLDEQLAEQRKQVEAAEAALQRYREQNDAISLKDRENIVVQKLTDLNAAVTKAKTERIQKEAMYRQLAVVQGTTTLDTFPAILANEYIQKQKAELAALQRQQAQMSDKLGVRHPEMVRLQSAIDSAQDKLQAEIAKVVEAIRTEYQAALGQEQGLARVLEQQKGEALAMNRKAIDYNVLERDVQSSKQIYENLLQRAKETGIAGELKASNISIVDPAEHPRRPASPNIFLNLTVGSMGALVFALALTFFFEYIDNRIKHPEEIRSFLGLTSIGMIPALRNRSSKAGHLLINNGVPPNFAEAFRSLRTNILFSSATAGPRSLVITSTAPGEGKTTVACNLAIGIALTGQRVLLIDGDMRRPRAHDVFKHEQEPGLSNLLVGETKISEAVRRTTVPGLWLLTAGKIPPNPAELLGSPRFHEFIASLDHHFDRIVIDSPPVMAVSDATITASAATSVIFVIGAEMTSRRAARVAVEQLAKGRTPILGAVLNRVQLEKDAYYYSQYYRRDYSRYYQAAQG